MPNHYTYWDQFVKSWCASLSPIGGWTDPDDVPVLNTLLPSKDHSSQYVPEPWWGNDGSKPLYSVCVNLNPGKGEEVQTRADIAPLFTGYSALQALPSLVKTADWHRKKRAEPIGNALNAVSGALPSGHTAGKLENHLSVELIPWHTQSAAAAFGYWNYLKQNLLAIYCNSLLFAAAASRRVIGKLNCTVLLRFSGNTATRIFNMLKRNGIIQDYNTSNISLSNSNVKCTIFTVQGKANCPCPCCEGKEENLEGIRFVAIWRSKSWNANDFPDHEDMVEIMRNLIHYKIGVSAEGE